MKKLTKEEKKKQKEIQKNKTKICKRNKILFGIILVFIILSFTNNLVMYFNADYAYFFIKYIDNIFKGIAFNLFSYIPYGSWLFLLLFFVFLFVLVGIEIYYENICKKDIKYINKKCNIIYSIEIIIFFIYVCVAFNGYTDNHLDNMDKYLFKEYVNKTYTLDDLKHLDNYLTDEVLEYASSLDRDKDGTLVYDGDYNKDAVKALRNVSNDLPILEGLYPAKSYNVNDLMKSVVGSDVSGLTHLYSTYFDYKSATPLVLNTMMHEYCHTKNILKENEATFCSIYAGLKSNDKMLEYSSYLEALSRVNYSLYELKDTDSLVNYDKVISTCLTKNYNEMCSVTIKNTDSYIKGSYELYMRSYMLKNYIGFEDELRESLSILLNNGAVIYMDSKEVNLDDIFNNINEDSNKYIVIKINDWNNKIYNKVKNAISNEKLYYSVYQKNYEQEESEEKDDLEKYYLAPYPTKDSFFMNTTILSVDFTYERSTRLILEYYDSIGYLDSWNE